MLPDIQPGNTKILYFFNCLLDGMHTNRISSRASVLNESNSNLSIRLMLMVHSLNTYKNN